MQLSKLILLTCALALAALAADYKLTLYEKSLVAGTELAPGDYKVQVNGDKAKIASSKQSVEASVRVETAGEKYNVTAVRYNNGDGKYRVQEIRLGGTNTKLIFAN